MKSVGKNSLFAGCLILSAFGATASDAATPAAHEIFTRKSVVTAAPKKIQTIGNAVVVNAASYLPGISPGGLVTIFGQNLSNVSGVVLAGTDPLPQSLEGVEVRINGRVAPVYGVAYAGGQDQISVQVPYSTEIGPGAAEVQVYNNGALVADLLTDSFVEDPGIFIYDGTYAVAVRYQDGSLIGPNNPAHPGDIVIVYTTGLGPLNQVLPDGYGAPSNPLAYTQQPFQIDINGEPAQVLFSGLGPGYVGLYQLNIVLPNDLPAGNLKFQIFDQYVDSGVAILPVN